MKLIKFIPLIFLFLLFSVCKAFGQGIKNYTKEWKKVADLMQKNLPKSALEEVKKIYTMAKNEGQDAQVIKSLVHMIGLQQETREGAEMLAINEVEKEIADAKEPAVSILKSLQAGLYWQYFQNYRWQLYQRTNTVNFNKEDIATWTLEDFHQKISELYLQSIRNQSLLQQTGLEQFDAIIYKGNMRPLRPTLFDLLAHRALDYFKNDERDIKKPAYAFEINQKEAFAPAAQFAAHSFPTKDSLSLQHKALLIYQNLVSFHLNDKKPDALIDVDIDRIEFVHQNSVSENKKDWYKEALENLLQKYDSNPVAAQAGYLLAAYYESLAALYDPLKDTTHRYARIRAKEILEKVVKDSAVKTEGWTNSYNLLQEIRQSTFSLETEKVNIPGQPFRTLVKFRNLRLLHFRLVKAEDMRQNEAINFYDEKAWDALLKAKPVRSWQQSLPETNDLQEHAAEIKTDALPAGEYVLLASTDQQFQKKKNVLGAQMFFVSNISYINKDNRFFVLHRQSGQPLANAAVQVYVQRYDYQTSKYSRVRSGSYQTDKNGFFETEKKGDQRNDGYYLDIRYKDDRLNLDDRIYDYYPYYGGALRGEYQAHDKEFPAKVFFFTDRSIYRPGQTVFFKGIAVTKNNNSNNIVAGYKTKIFLANANNEVVDTLSVTANEYGSFSGKFSLPQNVLNGQFHIYEKDTRSGNNVWFSVEEYKRPKFYVDFEKVKESYKVNDRVKITGNAKAYAGNVVDGAKVVYRVVRQPRFIYPWLFRGWWPVSEPMEIAHGETTTDTKGQFALTFEAIPDRKLDKKIEPVFDYRIYTDVTDMNGETRSGEYMVSAGYKSLLLNVSMQERLPVDSLKNISIRTENMNGEYQPSTINVSVFKLTVENRLIRKRYWKQPDLFVMNMEEFISSFPHDEYKNESDYHTWPKGEKVFEKTDSTRVNGEWSMVDHKLSAGFYAVEITTKDKDGQPVKDVRFVELFDPASHQLNKPEYIWSTGSDRPVEPGQKASLQLGTSAGNVFIIQQTDKGGEGVTATKGGIVFNQLNSEKKTFDLAATEADRGGYGVSFFFVKDNRFYQSSHIINVPWSNKELNIEYTTFRDKTEPGSKEKWKVKISGYKGEKVAAEMLAGMYDASLDQFKMHSWSKPGIWPTYSGTGSWNGRQNFTAAESILKQVERNDFKEFDKRYDVFTFESGGQGTDYNPMLRRIPKPMLESAEKVAGAPMAAPVANQAMRIGGRAKQDLAQDAAAAIMTDTLYSTTAASANRPPSGKPEVQPRKNFNETAFFFPDLHTDKDGNIEFSFTLPEALTRWKLQTFAHTKDLAFGLSQKEMVTQKELMVQPNTPRFLREGDRMELSAKIVNLSAMEITGQAELQLLDATTNQPINALFRNTSPNQHFTVAAGQSGVVKFPVEVSYGFNKALVWRIVAKAGKYSDGEEAALPVLTNRMLVTETMPLPMRGSGTKNFTFEKLLNSGKSQTLQQHAFTVEYTSNPAWYAVQALPYLMEFPYECAEQVWNRYYANALATKIVHSSPRIKQVFEKWKTADTSALLSNLQKNEELKSVLLQETPWVLEAKTESQQKKNIALLFDLVRMSNELNSNLQKLKEMQSPNGGFVWFKGGPDDRYITQYILTGIGHLKKLGGVTGDQQDALYTIVKAAIPYLDKKIAEDYERLIKHKADLKKQNIGYFETQYLYLRSFFTDHKIPQSSQTAYNYYRSQAQQFWAKGNKYVQGMTALALNRTGDAQTPKNILRSLKETSITNEEMGMYWKESRFGFSWFWWEAPIETQALLIEAFSEIAADTKTTDDLKTWLLKNKQTNNWHTTKATADACYALLLQGSDWITAEPSVTIKSGSASITNTEQKTEAGTGYFKTTVEGSTIKPEMGNIRVTVQQPIDPRTHEPVNMPTWGAVYWQYFENLDKITFAATPLQLSKKLFIEKNTDRGPVLTPVEEGTTIPVGSKIKVRIELRVDRDMEYVHMKDMRASALEPTNVLSGYRWQGGLGYYETTKDASTNFFFNYLRKGTYVFEYPLFVTHAGNFSNGITSIQCMYAPEFTAHSEGVRITTVP